MFKLKQRRKAQQAVCYVSLERSSVTAGQISRKPEKFPFRREDWFEAKKVLSVNAREAKDST
jgi:hypothetical protein